MTAGWGRPGSGRRGDRPSHSRPTIPGSPRRRSARPQDSRRPRRSRTPRSRHRSPCGSRRSCSTIEYLAVVVLDAAFTPSPPLSGSRDTEQSRVGHEVEHAGADARNDQVGVDAERGAQAAERRASAGIDRIRRTRTIQWQRERRVGARQWTEASKWLGGIGGRWASTEREKTRDQRGRRTDGAETAPFRYGHKCLLLLLARTSLQTQTESAQARGSPTPQCGSPIPQCSPSRPLGRGMRLPSGQRTDLCVRGGICQVTISGLYRTNRLSWLPTSTKFVV